MQNRQLKTQTSQPRSRLLVAVMTAIALVAASGMFVTSAQAQGSGQFVFQGGGWGHGVGMSQNGARNAANNGGDHVQILNFYYPNTIISQVAPLDNIRVHVGDASRVEMSSEGSIVFERGGVAINSIPSGSITVSAHDGGLQIGNAWTTGSASDPLFVSFPQPIKLANNGHRYLWGKLQITNKNGKVRVVEVLPLEDYVAGIAEMPAAWPLEALMAQAIAARTYAHEVTLHRRNSEEWAQEYDISGSTVDQNYIGYDAQDSAWDQKWLAAVKATAGAEIVDSNGPIRAYYSATNGGYTETAAYVFNKDVPYTVAGPDPYDAGGHDWTTWTRTYSQESMSRWLNAHSDTSVGTLTAINVGGGAGASSRIDKAVVELVGTSGTKRVTGKRLMLVMNAGIFGEGGGLATHLPGTFTTIGNGTAAGWPTPTGAPVPTTITPDPVAETVSANEGFTPPPGWRPEPGTGVAPGGTTATATDGTTPEAAEDSTTQAPLGTLNADGTFTPAEGWVPEAGTGVRPDGAESDAASAPATTSDAATFTPPADWKPEPGTGVAPSSGESVTGGSSASGTFTPPADWKPEPGTGIFPNAVEEDTTTVGGTGGGYTPPAGWVPEAGTGVAPTGPSSQASSASSASSATTSSSPSSSSATASSSSSSSSATASSSSSSATTSSTSADEPATVGSANAQPAAASGYTPPEGWSPAPGTGIAPGTSASIAGASTGSALASGVLLVTRTADGTELTDANFEVIAPTEDLAAESRQRLQALQARAALGLFADVDIDGYVASVAPRPVHGVCTATVSGVTCVPIDALQD